MIPWAEHFSYGIPLEGYKTICVGWSQGIVYEEINIRLPLKIDPGPLLFTLYVNQLSNFAQSRSVLFADDTTLHVKMPLIDVLSAIRTVRKIHVWIRGVKFKWIAKKMKAIVFTKTVPNCLNLVEQNFDSARIQTIL